MPKTTSAATAANTTPANTRAAKTPHEMPANLHPSDLVTKLPNGSYVAIAEQHESGLYEAKLALKAMRDLFLAAATVQDDYLEAAPEGLAVLMDMVGARLDYPCTHFQTRPMHC